MRIYVLPAQFLCKHKTVLKNKVLYWVFFVNIFFKPVTFFYSLYSVCCRKKFLILTRSSLSILCFKNSAFGAVSQMLLPNLGHYDCILCQNYKPLCYLLWDLRFCIYIFDLFVSFCKEYNVHLDLCFTFKGPIVPAPYTEQIKSALLFLCCCQWPLDYLWGSISGFCSISLFNFNTMLYWSDYSFINIILSWLS